MKVKIIVGIIIVSLLAGGGWYFFLQDSQSETVVETVQEATAKQDDLVIDFLADGTVMIETYDLSFISSGVISDVQVDIGDYVEDGQVLAMLDTSELELKIAQAKLDLQMMEDKLEAEASGLSNDIQIQNLVLSSLYGDLDVEKKTLEDMETYSILYTADDIENQKAKIAGIQSQITMEQVKLTELTASVNGGESLELENIELGIQVLELELESSVLRSNVSGVVAEIKSHVGDLVGTSTSVMTLVNQKEPKILAKISELDIHQIYSGQKVYVEFESEYGKAYEGTVTNVSLIPDIDNNGIVTYDTEIELVEFPESIRSGLTTLLRFVMKERLDALIIPNSAVTLEDGVQSVEVKTETGSEKRDIITGLTDGMNVEVLSGLSAGEKVIIRKSN